MMVRTWAGRLRALPLSLVLFAVAGDTHASDCYPSDGLSTCVLADNLWTHPGKGRWWSQAPTHLPATHELTGAVTASYVRRPIGLVMSSPDPAGKTVYSVDNSLSGQFGLSAGLASRLSVSLVTPIILFQDGAGKSEVTGQESQLVSQAVGDIRLGTHFRLLTKEQASGWPSFAIRFETTLPTGSSQAYASSSSVVFAPGASLEHRWGPLAIGADVGARIRRETELVGSLLGSEITASLGVQYALLAASRLSIGAEVFTRISLLQQSIRVVRPITSEIDYEPAEGHLTPTEWILTARSGGYLDGRLDLAVAGGGSVPTGTESAPTAPAVRAMFSVTLRTGAPAPKAVRDRRNTLSKDALSHNDGIAGL